MQKIIYNLKTINYKKVFEQITGVNIKDCFFNEKINRLIYVTNENDIAKAIGKNGINVKRVANITKKNIKVIEYNTDLIKFVENIIAPIKAKEIFLRDNILNIVVNGVAEKGQLIGRDSKNLDSLKELISKYFDISDVKII